MNRMEIQNRTNIAMLVQVPTLVIWINWSACLRVMVLHGRIFSSCWATVLGAIDPFLSLAMVESVLSVESGFEALNSVYFSSSPSGSEILSPAILSGSILSGSIVAEAISKRLKIDHPILV